MESLSQRVTVVPEHRATPGRGPEPGGATTPEEVALLMTEPALAGYVAAFRESPSGADAAHAPAVAGHGPRLPAGTAAGGGRGPPWSSACSISIA